MSLLLLLSATTNTTTTIVIIIIVTANNNNSRASRCVHTIIIIINIDGTTQTFLTFFIEIHTPPSNGGRRRSRRRDDHLLDHGEGRLKRRALGRVLQVDVGAVRIEDALAPLDDHLRSLVVELVEDLLVELHELFQFLFDALRLGVHERRLPFADLLCLLERPFEFFGGGLDLLWAPLLALLRKSTLENGIIGGGGSAAHCCWWFVFCCELSDYGSISSSLFFAV